MSSNRSLIENLVKEDYLRTPRIISAFRKIDRKDFVPESLKKDAYLNEPLSIGLGQTISQPLTVAFMLELLLPKPGEKILDVGSGSGWQTTLLAHIVGESGRVVAIERISELKKMTEENLAKHPDLVERVEIILGDGSRGYMNGAPYDKVIAAAAGEDIPMEWKMQLKIGGVIVAPIQSSVIKMTKISEDKFKEEEYVGFSFVPLIKDRED